MEHCRVTVRTEWDPEARICVATSPNVPGPVAEAASLKDLHETIAGLLPELLELNGI